LIRPDQSCLDAVPALVVLLETYSSGMILVHAAAASSLRPATEGGISRASDLIAAEEMNSST
jgi:hypothetical protein